MVLTTVQDPDFHIYMNNLDLPPVLRVYPRWYWSGYVPVAPSPRSAGLYRVRRSIDETQRF